MSVHTCLPTVLSAQPAWSHHLSATTRLSMSVSTWFTLPWAEHSGYCLAPACLGSGLFMSGVWGSSSCLVCLPFSITTISCLGLPMPFFPVLFLPSCSFLAHAIHRKSFMTRRMEFVESSGTAGSLSAQFFFQPLAKVGEVSHLGYRKWWGSPGGPSHPRFSLAYRAARLGTVFTAAGMVLCSLCMGNKETRTKEGHVKVPSVSFSPLQQACLYPHRPGIFCRPCLSVPILGSCPPVCLLIALPWEKGLSGLHTGSCKMHGGEHPVCLFFLFVLSHLWKGNSQTCSRS